jgi:hypothetical protein
MKCSKLMICLVPVFLILTLARCGRNGAGSGANGIDLATLVPLTGVEEKSVLFVREEEKLARDIYLSLHAQWGDVSFYNIATNSEQTHMDRIKAVLDQLGIADPVVSDATGAFTDTAILDLYDQLLLRGLVSREEAFKVGGFIEEFDIIDVKRAKDEMIAGTNQAAMLQTYESLICGSRNHLRSFVGNIQALGGTYVAQKMTQAEVDAIVNSPSETCGPN